MLIMDTTTQIFKILKQKDQSFIVKVIFFWFAYSVSHESEFILQILFFSFLFFMAGWFQTTT